MSALGSATGLSRLQLQGARFDFQELFLNVASPNELLLPANPLRVLIIWSSTGAANASVTTNGSAIANVGFLLPPPGGNLSFWFARHGAIVQAPWYSGGFAGGWSASVLTMDYHEDW